MEYGREFKEAACRRRCGAQCWQKLLVSCRCLVRCFCGPRGQESYLASPFVVYALAAKLNIAGRYAGIMENAFKQIVGDREALEEDAQGNLVNPAAFQADSENRTLRPLSATDAPPDISRSVLWPKVSGPLTGTIAVLTQCGWDVSKADVWTSPSGTTFALSSEGSVKEATEVFADEFARSMWQRVALGHNGAGLEQGVALHESLFEMRRAQKNDDLGFAAMLLAFLSGSIWDPLRKVLEGIGGESVCSLCGAVSCSLRHVLFCVSRYGGLGA